MKLNTWTITVSLTVHAGDMPKEQVIQNAEDLLQTLLDGTDFTSTQVINAKRDTY